MARFFPPEQSIVLPQDRPRFTALYSTTKGAWFEDMNYDWRFDNEIEKAFVAQGIGELVCPTNGEWTAFCVGGAVIARLTNRYMVFSESVRHYEERNLKHHLWENLVQASGIRAHGVDIRFLGAMLRTFKPREYHPSPERPYRRSSFVFHWREYRDTHEALFCNLRIGVLRSGQDVMRELPKEIQTSISETARYVPPMLEVARTRIRFQSS